MSASNRVGKGIRGELMGCQVQERLSRTHVRVWATVHCAAQMRVCQSLGIWVKGRFCPSRSGVGPEILHS